ncbi:hypothetical protein EJB05_39817 [Eragrostis curvula]|uniref:Uncharacterized protein n=1 Tax=Eragrostis curvula TaxID=38414 RepID=A0A5J9TXZ6_9POAL|nr:hypothetical protein EJB05_39817 [Eragrostis curvula]
MWTCMNSFNNAGISKQGSISIKVTSRKVPLLLCLYGKGEFFVVAHQRYAICKRVGTAAGSLYNPASLPPANWWCPLELSKSTSGEAPPVFSDSMSSVILN